jgi:hypothetical protein
VIEVVNAGANNDIARVPSGLQHRLPLGVSGSQMIAQRGVSGPETALYATIRRRRPTRVIHQQSRSRSAIGFVDGAHGIFSLGGGIIASWLFLSCSD